MANSFAHNPQSSNEMPMSDGFPRWMYGPGGQAQIFENEESIPEGWEDHPSKVQEVEPEPEKTETADQPETEEEKQEGTTSESEESAENKAPSTSPEEESVSEAEMRSTLKKKSVPELQSLAEELGLDHMGSKKELINRITEKLMLESQQDNSTSESL